MTDYNFFDRVTVASTSFPGTAQIIFTFGGNPAVSLVNEGTDTIRYSFDGTTVHGDLVPGTASSSVIFSQRGISKIWFKGVSGASTTVRVEATLGGNITVGSSSLVSISSSQAAIPVKGTVTARQVLTTSATLPAAGAYEAVPLDAACVTVPTGSRRATVFISYTRGAASGQAAHKIYVSNGTEVAQCMSIDGTYNGINGAPSTGAGAILYTIPVDLIGGETKISIASAEVGITATPGAVSSTICFG